MMNAEKVKSVLRGSMLDLPMQNSRIVRIFISSTFTDTKEERNMLMEDVYPKLSAYCKEKYGLEFQVVDMRWGVPDEASDDHLATELCLQEIQNCQRLSTGPNFVTFLNQKHGYHHLQSTIASTEFEHLVQALQEMGQDPDLLMKWYKQDINSTPAVHILQPISYFIPGYKNRTEVNACLSDLQDIRDGNINPDKPTFSKELELHLVNGVFKGNHVISTSKYSFPSTKEKFLNGVIDNITKRFPDGQIMTSFGVLGMRPITMLTQDELVAWGNESMQVLCDHFGRELSHTYKEDGEQKVTTSAPLINPTETLEEWKKSDESVKEWNVTYHELRKLLKAGSQNCHDQGKITEHTKHKYFMSVTEEEIVMGILNTPGKVTNHCLCFIRIIDDIEEHLDHDKAWRFIDMVDKNLVDKEAQVILSSLRDQRLVNSIDKFNITRKSVKWSNNGGINKQDHDQYLRDFGELFYNGVKSLVDKAVVEEQKLLRDGLYIEVLHHLSIAKERCDMFHGREEIIDKIQEYLSGDSDQPLTVFGPSGSGKTSVLAEVARQVHFTLHSEAIVILRFLGTSPGSSNLQRLLQNLSKQILVNIGGNPMTVPEDFNELLGFFHDQIEKYGKNCTKPLVIILDSLDQLTKEYAAHKLTWLPKKLPANVRLVISTYTDSSNIILTLQSFFVSRNFVIVKVLGEELSFKILKTWIQKKNRSLTPSQFEIVQQAFKLCSLPLYVKLVFEEILTWKSYTVVDKDTLAYTVQDSISSLLQRLETKHGKTMVSRGFAYITASHSGLSETELEDILSLDDVLLTDVFKFHIPPIRRIPSLLWVRVRHDISSYLADKEVDGVRVFFWYHRQFFETAEKRYLSDIEFKKEIHSLIADYFLGKWYQTPKPFAYTASQVKKLGLSSADSEADRKVAAQPISFLYQEDGKGKERYNVRKLNKLPFHLALAERNQELRNLCLFNYKWLVTKLKATSVNQVLEDFTRCQEEKSFLQRVLKTAQSTLAKYPETLATEIIGHCLPLLSDGKRLLEKLLVDQCLTSAKGSKTVIPYQTCYNTPNEALLFNVEHQQLPFGSHQVAVSNSSTNLFAFTQNNVLIMWDLATGEIERQIEILDKTICKMNIMEVVTKHNLILLGSSYQKQQNIVVLVDMMTADIIENVELQKTYPSVGFTDSLKFKVTADYILCLHVSHAMDIFERKTGKHIHEFTDIADEVHLSPDESRILYHVRNSKLYKIYNLASWQVLSEFSCRYDPKQILFDPSGTEVVVLYNNSHLAHVFNVEYGRTGNMLTEISLKENIMGAEFSMNEEFLLLKTNDGIVMRHYKSNRQKQNFVIPESIKPHHRVMEFLGHLTPDGNYFVVAYEGYFVIWNATSGKLLRTVEVSRSKMTSVILSRNGEFLVTTSKRNNFISVWKVTALIGNQSKNDPLTMKTAARYMCVSSTGDTAILRGTNANEVAVVNILDGHIEFFISKEEDVMRPTITPNGHFGVLRAYDSSSVLKVWNTKTGVCEGAVHLSSLLVKHYVLTDNQIAVYINNDSKIGELSFWTIPELKLINTVTLWEGNIADMCMFFVGDANHFMVSRQKEGADVAIVDLVVLDLSTKKDIFTFPSVQATRTQPIPGKKSQFLIQQHSEDKSTHLMILDLESKTVIRKGELYPASVLSLSNEGKYGIDKERQLYDLLAMKTVHQFDSDGEYVDAPSSANSPRILPDGSTVVWLNISAGLMMVGDVKTRQMVSVCPIHSIPICIEVTRQGLILIGCEDGRLMILQLADDTLKENEGFIASFLTRYKKQTLKSKTVKFVLPEKINGQRSFRNKTKSSICSLL